MAQDQIIRSLYEAISRHDFNKFVSHFNDDGVFNDIATGRVYRGKNEIRAMAESWLKAFPDMRLEVSNVISGSNDLVCAELKFVGTHNGPLDGPQGVIAPTGKSVNVPSCDVIRVKNNKIQSVSCYFSATVMMSQLGLMPMQKAA